MARFHIFKCKQAKQKPDLYIFLIEYKNDLLIEHDLMTNANESEKLEKNGMNYICTFADVKHNNNLTLGYIVGSTSYPHNAPYALS